MLELKLPSSQPPQQPQQPGEPLESGPHRQHRAQSAPTLGKISSVTSVAKCPPNIERMFETFHQSPSGDYRPTYYNPFEIKHRRRTTKQQFRLLEQTFTDNPKPSATVRRNLAQRLGMTPRAVQVWFQNRRAKVKAMESKGKPEGGGESGLETTPHPEGGGAQELPMASGTTSGGSHQVPASPAIPLSAISAEDVQSGAANLKRRHSMPNMKANELPFKQLRDALFGPGGIPLAPPPPPPMAPPGFYHQPAAYHQAHHYLPSGYQHHLEQLDPMLGYHGAQAHPDYAFPSYRQGSPTANSLAIPMDLDQFLQSIIAAPPNGEESPNSPAEFDHLSSLLYGHHQMAGGTNVTDT